MTGLFLGIKSVWRRYTDFGPRLHLQWPVIVRASRTRCQDDFYITLSRYIEHSERLKDCTNEQLASALEQEAFEHAPLLSLLDSLVEEAVRRLRGPVTPAEVEAGPADGGPVLATRRSEP